MNTTEQLAREVLDALSGGDVERAGPLVAEDFTDHGAPPWAPQGRAGYLQILGFLSTVLRLRYELHEVVAAGDMVAIRATAQDRDHAAFRAGDHERSRCDSARHVPFAVRENPPAFDCLFDARRHWQSSFH